jgi:hypothetical protein
MPRLNSPLKNTPSYCLHKRSGRAYVTLSNRQVWLGEHGTPESRAAYDRAVGGSMTNGRKVLSDAGSAISVSGVRPGSSFMLSRITSFRASTRTAHRWLMMLVTL